MKTMSDKKHFDVATTIVTIYGVLMVALSTAVLVAAVLTDLIGQSGIAGWIVVNLFYVISGACLLLLVNHLKYAMTMAVNNC